MGSKGWGEKVELQKINMPGSQDTLLITQQKEIKPED